MHRCKRWWRNKCVSSVLLVLVISIVGTQAEFEDFDGQPHDVVRDPNWTEQRRLGWEQKRGAWWADGTKHAQLMDTGGLRIVCSHVSTAVYQYIDPVTVPWFSKHGLDRLQISGDLLAMNVHESDHLITAPQALAGVLLILQYDQRYASSDEVLIEEIDLVKIGTGPFEKSLELSGVRIESLTLALTCTGFEGDYALAHIQIRAFPGAHNRADEPVFKSEFIPTMSPGQDEVREIGKSMTSSEISSHKVTLCLHASLDRLQFAAASILQWQLQHSGKTCIVSLALWRDDTSLERTLELVHRAFASEHIDLSNMLVIAQFQPRVRAAGEAYPINTLRNMALRAVKTEYVLLLDADLLVGGNFVSSLMQSIKFVKRENLGPWAFVIPAFEEEKGPKMKASRENLKTCKEAAQARNKAQLRAFVRRGLIAPYKAVHQPRAHGPTDFDRWFREQGDSGPYEIGRNIDEQFEPYIILRVRDVEFLLAEHNQQDKRLSHRLFDERFKGYGWNKVAMIATLAQRGFHFVVLSETWVIHCAHEKSAWSRAFSSDPRERARNRALRFKWAADLRVQDHNREVLLRHKQEHGKADDSNKELLTCDA